MSRSVSTWVGRTDDTPPPKSVKDRIFLRQDGVCACGCGVKMAVAGEAVEFDHEQALILGGANDENNLRALRRPCHAAKTRADVAQKSTEARKRAKHLGLKPKSKAQLPGSKASKWKRRVDGTVVRRDEE